MRDALHVFDRLLGIALLIQQDMGRSFTGTGLTPARAHLLWVIDHSGPSTQQALAEALDVSPRNVTGLVDALQTHGFVERHPHPGDRRATRVRLTTKGEQTVADMAVDRRAIAAGLVEGFGDDRVERLGADLDAITGRLHTMMAAAP